MHTQPSPGAIEPMGRWPVVQSSNRSCRAMGFVPGTLEHIAINKGARCVGRAIPMAAKRSSPICPSDCNLRTGDHRDIYKKWPTAKHHPCLICMVDDHNNT